jgi:hypothetical protein
MDIFNALGFRWDRNAVPAGIPVHSVERACFRFHRMLPEFVWDATALAACPTKMVNFYRTKDGTEMVAFLASCHPNEG